MRRIWQLVVGLCTLLGGVTAVSAQNVPPEQLPLRIARLDPTDFPRITFYLAAADPRQPLREDLVGFTLSENGLPVTNFTLAREAVGIDLVIILDANESILAVDGEREPTRLKKVQDALVRFATQAMDPAGLDRISVLVPEGENGRFLLQNGVTPGELVNAIVAYAPAQLGPTPIQAMFDQALDHLQGLENEHGRFQAIFLLSDGGQLDQQLEFADLADRANLQEITMYAAILGGRADPNEIENVTRLTDPTSGLYLHMPQPEAADPLFALWQALGLQIRLQYRTPLVQDGRLQSALFPGARARITLSLGSQQLNADYALDLAPPKLALLLTSGALIRAGDKPDTPLADLLPVTQTVPLQVQWPDGMPRDLVTVTLLANGQPQVTLRSPEPDNVGLLQLEWPLADWDSGEVTLAVEAEDAFGLTATSDPVLLTILVQRPSPPTPTPAPSPTPVPVRVVVETTVADPTWQRVGLAALALLLGLLLLRFWWQRWRRRRAAAADLAKIADFVPSPEPDAPGELLAYLVLAGETAVAGLESPISLTSDNLTIGRDPKAAQIVIDDPTVARLHARIRRRPDGTFWLYDEGSASGTYLDYQRLGLAPRPIQQGSILQFGQVRCTFSLVPPQNPEDVAPEV